MAELDGRQSTHLLDTGLGDLRVLYYRVSSRNLGGERGAPSEVLRAVTKPAPLPPISLHVDEPAPRRDRARLGAQRRDRSARLPAAPLAQGKSGRDRHLRRRRQDARRGHPRRRRHGLRLHADRGRSRRAREPALVADPRGGARLRVARARRARARCGSRGTRAATRASCARTSRARARLAGAHVRDRDRGAARRRRHAGSDLPLSDPARARRWQASARSPNRSDRCAARHDFVEIQPPPPRLPQPDGNPR